MAPERRALAALLTAVLELAASHSSRAAESQRGIRLLGTVVSSDAARSLAMVEQGGAPRVVRTGGELDGAQVVEIRADGVLLRRNGKVETLALASLSRSSVAAVSTFPASPADVQEGDARGPADRGRSPTLAPRASQRRPAAARSAVSRSSSAPAPAAAAAPSEAEVARGNDELLADLASQARFAPVMDNDGKLRGVAVMNVLADSQLERLGLRSDDVITAIQGTKIDSSGQAMSVARGLSWSAPVKLDIERGGVAKVVVVDPRSVVKGR